MSESAWLIERVKADGTAYAPAQYFGYGDQSLTTDHMQAIRFCRKVDAEKAIKLLKAYLYCGTFETFAATEHQWDTGRDRTTTNWGALRGENPLVGMGSGKPKA